MSIHENKGSYPATKVQTEEVKFWELKPKLMSPEAMEEIINSTIDTINTDPKEFIFLGSGRKISYLHMRMLNKAPEDIRTRAVTGFVETIPSTVNTIILRKLPLPESIAIKNPTNQELAMILEAQKHKAEIQIVYEKIDLGKNYTYEVQNPYATEETIKDLKRNYPDDPVQGTSSVIIQKFYTPKEIQ